MACLAKYPANTYQSSKIMAGQQTVEQWEVSVSLGGSHKTGLVQTFTGSRSLQSPVVKL